MGVGSSWFLPLILGACGGTLDAGWDEPHGSLPIDERNPVVLWNDGSRDNWQGEYALLLASRGEIALAGIIIGESWPWTSLDDNTAGWQQMVTAARDSGLRDIPDPITSTGPALERPSDEDIDTTKPNQSEGARVILDLAAKWAKPFRPLVLVTGGRLTDVADAYLMDHTLPDRVTVVSSLGASTSDGAEMGVPNGQLDTWADIIVARRFRYVQISTYYDPAADVPSSLLAQLPDNPFAEWIEAKQPDIENAFDQVGIQAVALPSVVSTVTRVTQRESNADGIPLLTSDPDGEDWLVTKTNSALATARFWEMLLDPVTFAPP
ncbi:MAG: hypothetical protein QM784_01220 [Polyangiaceae bacterium]